MANKKQARFARGKAIIFPSSLSDRYERYILNQLKTLNLKIKNQLINRLPSFARELSFLRADDAVDEVEQIVNQLKAESDSKQLILLSYLANEALAILRFTSRQVAGSISSLAAYSNSGSIFGVNSFSSIFNSDLQILSKSWAYTNARLIKSLNSNLLDEVANVIQAGFRFGHSTTAIKNELQKRFDISSNKARFLAQDQIAKLHSNYALNEMKKFNIIIYGWNTAGDERVRHSHKVLQGKICSINNPHIYKNHPDDPKWLSKSSIGAVEKQPGEDYGCRCGMTPIIKL